MYSVFYMFFVSSFNIFLLFIIVILYLCYNDGLVLHNLILVIILMLYIVFLSHTDMWKNNVC